MRVADFQLTFPSILVAMLIFAIAKGVIAPKDRDPMAIWVLIIAIGRSDWVLFARVVRGAIMVKKSRAYVQAARLIGRRPLATLVFHILANVVNPIPVIATIGFALAVNSLGDWLRGALNPRLCAASGGGRSGWCFKIR